MPLTGVLQLALAKWKSKALKYRRRAGKAEEIGYLRDLDCRVLLSILECKQRQVVALGFRCLKGHDYRL